MKQTCLMRLDQALFLSTLQLVVPEIDHPDRIKAFGSGFMLSHKGRLFFVTADHVVHLDDRDAGHRTGRDYQPQIITNSPSPKELTSIVLPLGGFYSLTGYMFDDNTLNNPQELVRMLNYITSKSVDIDDETIPLDIRIPDMPEPTFCKIKDSLQCSLLSNQVEDADGNVLIPQGTPKIILDSNSVTKFKTDDIYYVAGTVLNNIVNGISLDRRNAYHGEMAFQGFDSEKNAILKTPENPNIDHWSGLSGAPVLNQDGLLAGVLLRGPKSESYAIACPIETVIRFIDQVLKIEVINGMGNRL
ncbi:MAG: hypothetical protein LUD17_16530 [Bacteroidales bacterium]|nr:hypothetical protein [Bacteroidales bacterium]